MRARSRVLLLGAALLAAAAGLTACFSPDKPACAFSCAQPPGACPESWSCGADGFCHNPEGVGACALGPADAGSDGTDDR